VLQYVIAGLVLGGIYAIAASGLVITFLSAGILNFSFGALAYTVARFYYYLNTQEHWAILPAGLLAICGLGPTLGVFLYFALFRLLRLASTLVKIVATLGISVAAPSVCAVIFGTQQILQAPGLAPEPVRVFDFLGVPVTMNQVIVYACVVAVVIAGVLVLRYTDAGLQVRAMVDSPAMTSLSGTNPNAVSVGVWAASIGLAGLVGVLSAPIIGLDAGDFTLLMVSAFAAVIAARLRSLPVAVGVGLAMGIATALFEYWLPPNSSFTAAVLPSIPFVVMAIFLVYFLVRRGGVNEAAGVGGALDLAIRPQGGAKATSSSSRSHEGAMRALSWRPAVVGFAVVCLLPMIVQGYWITLVGQGVCFGIIFLSYTLVVGEGGMIWLCMATFAGIGGFTMALLSVNHGWPVLPAVLVGGLVTVPFGLLIGFLTIRMGDLYVALVTLTFGLLFENLVFSRELFYNGGSGIVVPLPHFASGARVFVWLSLTIFALMALIIVSVRRSTTGLALSAVRWSEPGSKTLGISVLQVKVLVAGLAAFVAGIGGAMLALSLGSALQSDYDTLAGVVWLAVLVTLGIRSNMAALLAGLASTLVPGVALVYLPKAFGNVSPILFGLGAIAVAKYPEGTLAMQARQISGLWHNITVDRRSRDRSSRGPSTTEPATPANCYEPTGVVTSVGVVGGDPSPNRLP
jgi:branched-chain amino acid transport system permease protein